MIRFISKILLVTICGVGMFLGMLSCNGGVAEASDVWAYTDHTGEYYVRPETIKDKYIEPGNRKYTKQWFQVNVKQVRNGRLVSEQPWSFMQMRDGRWGYNPYPLLSMDARAEALWEVAMRYR